MHSDWESAHTQATVKTHDMQTAKSKKQEMDQVEKSTVHLVIYHTVHLSCFDSFDIATDIYDQANHAPLHTTCSVTSWPRIQLRDLKVIMDKLGLTNKSYIDYFCNSKWTTIYPNHVITNLDRNSRLLLRLRPSLKELISDEECPNIEAEYKLQWCGGKKQKQAASPDPSPRVVKVPRTTDSTNESISA
jgi:hypothetical protein